MIEVYTADPAAPRASEGGSRRLGLRVLRSEGKSKSSKPALNQLGIVPVADTRLPWQPCPGSPALAALH